MIKTGLFKRIFPVNRTSIYPNWGNSYVFNWPRFETYLSGYNLYRGVAVCMENSWGIVSCLGNFPHLRLNDRNLS